MIKRIVALAGLLIAAPLAATPVLVPAWTDHAVIQRGQPIVVEGTDAPDAKIAATLGGLHAEAIADASGHFALQFPAREASADPLTLAVADGWGEPVTISDILVGDVWLCSGQSNMEWPLSASVGGDAAVKDSADDGLRLLVIPKATALFPQTNFGEPAKWTVASPESAPPVSAACYYMARQLRTNLKIPIGAINSYWGGSQIRAWLSPEAGLKLYGADQMALLAGFEADPLRAVTEFAPKWEAWWREGNGGQEPWKNPDVLQWRPVPQIGPWTSWTDGPPAIGNVWFRRMLNLTAEQAATGGVLNIGIIDDLDATWINGHPVGITHGWSTEREYRIPAEFLREGANEIIVSANNSWGAGGMQSTADRLSFSIEGGDRIALGEGWTYAEGGVTETPPRAPWDANAGIGVMHNRMIAPFGHFALAGAAWYQGESDAGIPGYADRLRELFAGWRRQFGQEMRMLVVQLPNYGAVAEHPVDAGWAGLRNEEFKAVAADPNAALITIFDVGQRGNLHPPDKLQVGQRLALGAEGKALPLPTSARRAGGTIVVAFSGIEGGLHAWSGKPLGVELCAETQASCRYANATVSGDTLRIAADGRPATRVRYGWADSPLVNLYDSHPLPVPGFELPIGR